MSSIRFEKLSLISLIPQVRLCHIFDEMLLPVGLAPPQIPWYNEGLDLVSQPTSIGYCLNHVLRLFESCLHAGPPQLLVRVEGFLHRVGLALLYPSC